MRLGSRVVHEEGKHPRKVQLWDTPGDAPDDIPTAVFAATDVFVVTADATSKNMLASVPRLVDAIGDVRVVRGRPIPVVLLVTKMDAVSPSPEAILAVRQEALSLGAVLGMTVKFASALDGFGLDEAFADIVRMVPVTALMLTPPNSPRGGRTAPRVAGVSTPRTAANRGVDSFLGYMQAETEALTGKVGDTVPAAAKNRAPLEEDTLSPELRVQMAREEVDGGATGPVSPPAPHKQAPPSPISEEGAPDSEAPPSPNASAGMSESKGGGSVDLLGLAASAQDTLAGDEGAGREPSPSEYEGDVQQQDAHDAGEESVVALHEEGLRAHEAGGGRPYSAGSNRGSAQELGGGAQLHADASGASLPGGVEEGGAGGVGHALEG
mgnify:CR=1 FL=1